MSAENKKPEELNYAIIYATGKKRDIPADCSKFTQELIQGNGWVSEKNCEYPQELVLKFETKSTLKKIQVLAHHLLIPKSIEFFNCDDDDEIAEYLKFEELEFEKMGVATFRDNHTTNYQARELKTIFLDTDSLFLKLVINGNHKNEHNPFNQVSIMAIDIDGLPLKQVQGSRRASEAIKIDKQRRIERSQTAKRVGTAKAKQMLEQEYASELHEIIQIIEKKQELATKKNDKIKTEELTKALERLNHVNKEAVLLLKTQEDALSENDHAFADACGKEIRIQCKKVFEELSLEKTLTADERKTVGLDEFLHRKSLAVPQKQKSAVEAKLETASSKKLEASKTTKSRADRKPESVDIALTKPRPNPRSRKSESAEKKKPAKTHSMKKN